MGIIFNLLQKFILYILYIVASISPLFIVYILYTQAPKYSLILFFIIYGLAIFSTYKISKVTISWLKAIILTNIRFFISAVIFSLLQPLLTYLGLNIKTSQILISSILIAIYTLYCLYGISIFLLNKIKLKKIKVSSLFVPPNSTTQNNEKSGIETFLFNQGEIQLTNPFRGIYIQGGAGSGKSKSLIEPIIQQSIEKRYSGLLYDFKSPELIEYAYSFFDPQKTDIKPYFLDFKNPKQSHRVNVLEPHLMESSACAFEYAEVILNNLMPETIKKKDFFVRSSRSILAGVIWDLKQDHPEYCTLPHVISLILHTPSEKLIQKLSLNYEVAGMVSSIKEAMERGAERQVSAVLGTLKDSLALLNTPDIFYLLSGNDFSIDLNNILEPKFLMLGNDSTLSDTYAPVISLAISVAVRLMNRPNKHRSIVLLDEAPTLYISRFEQIPATARSNKLITVFGAQDYSQLVDRYGEDKASVLVSNLGNQFYGRTTNTKTAENISKLFSKMDKTFQSKSTGRGTSGKFIHLDSNMNRGINENIQERDRVKISDVINMEVGHFYGLIAEGSDKELLNIKMGIVSKEGSKKNKELFTTTEEEIKDNYLKIIQEAQSLLI